MREKVIFNTIKEAKENYMVDYTPVYDSNLAMLCLSFMSTSSNADMMRIMERELARWIEKYPVLTMVSACDDAGFYLCKNVKQF